MPASLNKKQPETEGKERVVGMRLGQKCKLGCALGQNVDSYPNLTMLKAAVWNLSLIVRAGLGFNPTIGHKGDLLPYHWAH